MKTWILACSMALVGTGVHAAQIPAVADSSVSAKKATAKLGSGKTLTVDKQTNALIRFDLGSLPSGTSDEHIAKAILRLWVNSKPAPGSLAVALPTVPWIESSVTGGNAPTFVATGIAKVLPTEANSYLEFDVTPIVKSWLNGTPNVGLMLTPEIPGNALKVVFDSRENTQAGRAPVLDIELAEVPVFRTFEFEILANQWGLGGHIGDDNEYRFFQIAPELVGGIDLSQFLASGGTVVAYGKPTTPTGFAVKRAFPIIYSQVNSQVGSPNIGMRIDFFPEYTSIVIGRTTNGFDSKTPNTADLPTKVKVSLTLIGPPKSN